MRYKDIYEEVARELNLPLEVVTAAYYSYWKFIKEKIKELPLSTTITEEEFKKLRTNFNIPSLGKLYCTYDKIIGIRKMHEYLKIKKK